MMEYKGYVGKVEFDEEAGILHGEVVGIRDVVTFQGESVSEVEQAFRDSVDDYLAFCKERKEKPDKPCSGKFLVRVSSDLHRRINVLAGVTGKSLNSVVAECLDKEVTDRLKQHGVTGSSSTGRKRKTGGRRKRAAAT
jgi:predicted HicB family RNase H-like nuclease